MKGSLRWRVLLILSLAATIPTVVVGVLAILRARHDVENEVKRGALAHIRALGSSLDGRARAARSSSRRRSGPMRPATRARPSC